MMASYSSNFRSYISLFLGQVSLFDQINSLLRPLGKWHQNRCKHVISCSLECAQRRDFAKFPALFPVSREFSGGDGFECDCVRRQSLRDWASSNMALGRNDDRFCPDLIFVLTEMTRLKKLKSFVRVPREKCQPMKHVTTRLKTYSTSEITFSARLTMRTAKENKLGDEIGLQLHTNLGTLRKIIAVCVFAAPVGRWRKRSIGLHAMMKMRRRDLQQHFLFRSI